MKLNKDLLRVLAEERQNEELREETMSKLKTKKERMKMEKEYGKERADASERIIKKNEEIEKKIKNYRQRLYEQNNSDSNIKEESLNDNNNNSNNNL